MADRVMPQLGRVVFQVSREGDINRTMVAKVYGERGWQFLNGNWNNRSHYYSFEEAVAVAEDRIKDHEARLRAELRALASKRKGLGTQSYRNSVMQARYRVADLRGAEYSGKLHRPRNLKKVVVPETYLLPGRLAYTVITPRTEPKPDMHRPWSHFVLEVEVQSVCFTPDGQVHYSFSTPFAVQAFFLSRKEAEAELEKFSEPGTKDRIRFVSREDEKKWLDSQPDDVPF